MLQKINRFQFVGGLGGLDSWNPFMKGILMGTPPKINIEPENDVLVQIFFLNQVVSCQVPAVNLPGLKPRIFRGFQTTNLQLKIRTLGPRLGYRIFQLHRAMCSVSSGFGIGFGGSFPPFFTTGKKKNHESYFNLFVGSTTCTSG